MKVLSIGELIDVKKCYVLLEVMSMVVTVAVMSFGEGWFSTIIRLAGVPSGTV